MNAENDLKNEKIILKNYATNEEIVYDKKDVEKWDKTLVWHPFTQMQEYEEGNPILIEKGEGNYLIDVNGKKYFDGVSSVWCNFFGHSENRISEAISEQAFKIGHSTQLGCGNTTSAILAKRFADFAPKHLNKVFFSEDGAEAVEIAVKMAFEYCLLRDNKKNNNNDSTNNNTKDNKDNKDNKDVKKTFKRTKFVSVKEGYHGDTVGAMSVGGSELFHGCFRPLLFDGYFAEAPYCYRCTHNPQFKDTDDRNKQGCNMKCLENIKKLITEKKDELFCVILEGGVMGSAGMIPYPKDYIEEVAKVCKEHDIIFILDEIATFGRLGSAFFSEREELTSIEKPDIICLGKAITGGYLPLALTISTDEIYNEFLGTYGECKQLFHGHTYAGNQIICAASHATLDILENDKPFEKIGETINYLHKGLDGLKELSKVGDVRKTGLMIAIEIVKDKETKEMYDYADKVGYKISDKLLEKGVYIRPIANRLIYVLPLTITNDEIDFICKKTYESINEAINEGILY
ncbi:aspartate aminotransferase family protein [Methanococcus voltae]|uniref:Adenosylmethionine-8-amino-7-oxononanoate aminotransferase n=1 Tax=Methanococcus voltae (strain ATCC BAA-1334 / A3) TaxID=456320 RepID=D7DTG0_METV3|nr:aminotransferase class III-fold pyridoxal phosphate-dependent enzyme [Methanococcus voltae]MCS3901272.1 adenosylmethionine-8-amino-7-oxononanoate aminotransferase [Methanococcus voltae]